MCLANTERFSLLIEFCASDLLKLNVWFCTVGNMLIHFFAKKQIKRLILLNYNKNYTHIYHTQYSHNTPDNKAVQHIFIKMSNCSFKATSNISDHRMTKE